MNQELAGITDPALSESLARPIHEIEIQWADEPVPGFPADEQLSGWVETVLAWLDEPPSEVAVRLMGSEEITELNTRYRNKAAPTNVLSFPAEVVAEPGRQLLGDIAICTDVIRREAGEQGKTLAAHTAHMLVHGVLHLCGYDHIIESEAVEMEHAEREILASLGFADPYASEDRQEEMPHE